jgi:hypothetical protein
MALDLMFLQSEQTLIPFLFVLAIIFGVLELTNVFRGNKAVNAIIALAISYFAVTNTSFVSMLWSQFGNITSFFLIMFFIAFIMEIVGLRGKGAERKSAEEKMLIVGAIFLVLLVFGFMFSDIIPSIPFLEGGGSNTIVLIAVILILVLFGLAFKAGPEAIQQAPPKGKSIPLYSGYDNILL